MTRAETAALWLVAAWTAFALLLVAVYRLEGRLERHGTDPTRGPFRRIP